MDVFIHKLLTFFNLTADYFQSIPYHWYFTAGVVLASIPLTAVVVQGIKHWHFIKTSKEMTNHLIDFTVIVTSAVMAGTDFLLTNGSNMTILLPFLGVVMPSIKAFAPTVYNVSKAVHGWSVNRKAGKPLFPSTLPELDGTTVLPKGTTSYTTYNTSSLGTVATGRATPDEQPKLIQL